MRTFLTRMFGFEGAVPAYPVSAYPGAENDSDEGIVVNPYFSMWGDGKNTEGKVDLLEGGTCPKCGAETCWDKTANDIAETAAPIPIETCHKCGWSELDG